VVDTLITMFGVTTPPLLLPLVADGAVGWLIIRNCLEIRAALLAAAGNRPLRIAGRWPLQPALASPFADPNTGLQKTTRAITTRVIIDVGIFVVVACFAPTVGGTRRVRHILLDHEFRHARARRPSIFAARYRHRDLFSGRFRADLPIAKLFYTEAPSISRMSGRCSRPQNSSPSSTKVGTPKTPMASAWRQICSSSCRPSPAR
jgi:hypothetical protein